MKVCWGRVQKIITYILVAGLFLTGSLPVTSQAATAMGTVAEKKSDVTEDKIMELSSDSMTLNKGNEVEVKFVPPHLLYVFCHARLEPVCV